MMNEKKSISAVTVTYFSELSVLRALLISVYNSSEKMFLASGSTFVYYIVDNSDDEEYFWQLETLFFEVEDNHFFSIHMCRAPENLGFSGGNNFIMHKLDSDYHLIINPDVIVQSDTLLIASQYLTDNQDVVMVSPEVVNGPTVKHVIKSHPNALTLLLRYLDITYLNHMFEARLSDYQCDHLQYEEDKSVLLAGGCFMLLRAKAYVALGGFDQRFFMYFEDYDLSIRARELGKIAYVPSVKISHMGGYVGKKSIKHHVFFFLSSLKFSVLHGWKLW
jgi:GT2 family glycosyltransferase